MRRPLISLIAATRPAILVLIVAACHSYRPVVLPPENNLPRDPKTEVFVTEHGGTQTRLVETRIEHDSIVGRNRESGEPRHAIAMRDVVRLETRGFSAARTAGATAGVILAVPVVLFLVLAIGCSGTNGC